MSNSQQSTRVMTVIAQGTITAKRGVTFAGTQATDGTSNAGDPCIGVADHGAVSGDALRVIRGETAMWESGAAINGAVKTLKTDSVGRVIPTSGGGDKVVAILCPGQTAAGAGEFIEVMPYTAP